MSGAPGSRNDPGVAIVQWPAEATLLEHLASVGTPRLVVVDPSAEPPASGDCSQDWVWQHTPRRERHLRMEQLLKRARAHNSLRPYLDDFGVLTFGEASVVLAEKERRLASVLIDKFDRPVTRAELGLATWGEADPSHSKLASRLTRLRHHVEQVGLEVERTPAGYRITRRTEPTTGDHAIAE